MKKLSMLLLLPSVVYGGSDGPYIVNKNKDSKRTAYEIVDTRIPPKYKWRVFSCIEEANCENCCKNWVEDQASAARNEPIHD